jgi:hypothetical protein
LLDVVAALLDGMQGMNDCYRHLRIHEEKTCKNGIYLGIYQAFLYEPFVGHDMVRFLQSSFGQGTSAFSLALLAK